MKTEYTEQNIKTYKIQEHIQDHVTIQIQGKAKQFIHLTVNEPK